MIDAEKAKTFMDGLWDKDIVPVLTDYIRIPNKSPAFDPDWEKHGHMENVVDLFAAWARDKLKQLPGSALEVVRLAGRTPLIFIEVPAQGETTRAGGTILMYGHLDKQPEMKGWAEGTGPWTPVLKNDRLYGRGGADDGYAMFAAISALLALKEQNHAHARAVIVIEACEESGSPDLPFYIEHLSDRIGYARSGGVPGFRLRQLRSALAHHILARHGDGQSHRPGADRRRAFRRCQRRGGLVFPYRAAASVAHRGRNQRPNEAG